MERFNQWLLSAVLCGIGGTCAHGQSPEFCNNTALRDSLSGRVYRTHSYTSAAYQAACDSLLALCPKWDNVYQMKAMPFIKKGRSAEAYYWLDKAVALNPTEHLDYRAFLKCLFTKDYAGALEDFAEAEKLRPGGGLMDHSYRFYSALCYLGLGNFSRATALLDEVAKEQEARLKTAHFNTYFYLGLARHLAGLDTESERAFAQCLAIHRQHPDAHFYLGRILKARGENEKADTHFRSCVSALQAGYNNSEDQEPYIRYPYEAGIRDAESELEQ